VSHLTGRVLKHVFDPITSDPDFNIQQASQLERTLMAFMPLLIDEEIRFGKYCAALGICTWYDILNVSEASADQVQCSFHALQLRNRCSGDRRL
jgi:hypothetical protein